MIQPNEVFMRQEYPEFSRPGNEQFEAQLGIAKKNLVASTFARNGVGYMLHEVDSHEILDTLAADQKEIYRFSQQHELVGVYAFAKSKTAYRTRMFAPFYGIEEENATGMAAGLLAGWLHAQFGMEGLNIEQGNPLHEKGYLKAFIESRGTDKAVWVGGEATLNQVNLDIGNA
jgi:PhzF family phenazine biosynthesis protein